MTKFLAKITSLAKFGHFLRKTAAQNSNQNHLKMVFSGPTVFSPWQISNLVILVPEKAQSSSWQIKSFELCNEAKKLFQDPGC